MKCNIKGLVLVLLLGVQGLLSGSALAYNAPDTVSVRADIVDDSPFPRSLDSGVGD